MPECEGFFGDIPFEEYYQEEAVYLVLSADFYDPKYKKWLIQCWFDTTYGSLYATRFNLNDSRVRMAAWIRTTSHRTYEDLIDAYDEV